MFEFKSELQQAEWMEFKTRIEEIFESKIKPVLREEPTSDVAMMVHKLEWLAGWLPWMGEKKALAEKYYKIARAEGLERCPYNSPEFKVRVWLEGEISEVEYVFNRLESIYRAATDSGMKLQTALRIESDLLGSIKH